MLWLLVENLFRRYINGFRHETLFHKFGTILSGVILFAVYISIFFFTSRFFSILSKVGAGDLDVYLLSIFLAGVLLYLFLGGISDATYHFSLNPDLSLLLSMPIAPHILRGYKLIEIILSKGLFLGVGLAVVWGYGLGLGSHAHYYPVASILFLCFCSIPIIIGIILNSLLARFIRCKRIRSVFHGLATCVFFLLLVMIVPLSHNSLSNPTAPSYLESFHELIPAPLLNWLPSGWLASSLFSLVTGNSISVPAYSLPLIISPFLLFLFLNLDKDSTLTISNQPAIESENARRETSLPGVGLSPFLTLLRFNTVLLARDSDYLKSKIYLLLFAIILPSVLLFRSFSLKHYSYNLHLYPIFSLMFDSTLIFREGKGFWWFKVCPSKIYHFVLGKLLLSLLINLGAVSALLGLVLILHGKNVTLYTAGIAWLRLATVCLVFSGFSVLIGSIFPGFDRPKFTLPAKGYLVCSIIIIGGLLYVGTYRNIFMDGFDDRVFAELAISFILALSSLWIGSKVLEKFEWKL